MVGPTRGFLVFVLVLAAAAAIPGCSNWPLVTTQKVFVGPGACDLNPTTDVAISKAQADQVKWGPRTPGTPLTIVFKVSGFPPGILKPPFANMPQNSNGDYYVPSTLQSGPINPQLTNSEIPANGLTYKYDQILGGIPCDGRIIIQR